MTATATENTVSQETEVKPTTQSHLSYLDGLRALAALYVVLYHAIRYQAVIPNGIAHPWIDVFLYGHLAVDVFIVISGYSLMLPVVRGGGLRGGYRGFMRRRARRILPPYYFALALSVILALTVISSKTGTSWDQGIPITFMSVATHLLLIHNLFASYLYSISAPFWSIAVEWQIYFLFPLLVAGWVRFGGIKTTLAAVVVGYTGLVLLRHTQMGGLTPQYLALFSLGMLGAALSFSEQALWSRLRRQAPWKLFTIMSAVVVIFLCCRYSYLIVTTHAGLVDFFVGLCTASLLVQVSCSGRSIARDILGWRPLVFVGTFAYSVYLVHYPLLQILYQYVLKPLSLDPVQILIALTLLSIPVSVGVAYIFFLACERPFLRSKPAIPRVS